MGLCLAHLVWSSSHVASRLKSRPAAAAWERADPAKPMEFALPLFAVQCLANGQWLVRTQMGDPILPVVDVVVVVGAQTDIRRDPESAAAEAASAQVISSMRDQVTSSGAINSMIAAMSTRPNRQNRSTCSRRRDDFGLIGPGSAAQQQDSWSRRLRSPPPLGPKISLAGDRRFYVATGRSANAGSTCGCRATAARRPTSSPARTT